MTIKLINILLDDIDNMELSPEDRISLTQELTKAIEVLSIVIERFKALKIKAMSDDKVISDITIKIFDRRVMKAVILLCESIASADYIESMESVDHTDSQEKEIIVKDPIVMKSVIKLIDSLFHYTTSLSSKQQLHQL